MLYPGVTIARKPIFGLTDQGYTILLVCFNLFDSIGKELIKYIRLTQKQLYFLLFIR